MNLYSCEIWLLEKVAINYVPRWVETTKVSVLVSLYYSKYISHNFCIVCWLILNDLLMAYLSVIHQEYFTLGASKQIIKITFINQACDVTALFMRIINK